MAAISPSATVKLNASGAGQCSMTPPAGTRWDLQLAAVSTTSAVNFAQAFLYLGSANGPVTLIDSTYDGNSASSDQVKGTPIYHGQYLWAKFTGGDSGAIATLQAYGQQVTRYRKASS